MSRIGIVELRWKGSWHPKDFGEALRLIDQRVEYGERVARIRMSLEPYRRQGRLCDVHDFDSKRDEPRSASTEIGKMTF